MHFFPDIFGLSEKVQQVVQLVNFKDKLLDTICQMIVNDDPLRTNKEIFMEEFSSGWMCLPMFLSRYLMNFMKRIFLG